MFVLAKNVLPIRQFFTERPGDRLPVYTCALEMSNLKIARASFFLTYLYYKSQ